MGIALGADVVDRFDLDVPLTAVLFDEVGVIVREADAKERRVRDDVERGEEAVVSKTARVTEEIGLRKDVEHETETIRDTVRKQEVEIEDDRGLRKSTGTGTVAADTVVDPDLAGTSR